MVNFVVLSCIVTLALGAPAQQFLERTGFPRCTSVTPRGDRVNTDILRIFATNLCDQYTETKNGEAIIKDLYLKLEIHDFDNSTCREAFTEIIGNCFVAPHYGGLYQGLTGNPYSISFDPTAEARA